MFSILSRQIIFRKVNQDKFKAKLNLLKLSKLNNNSKLKRKKSNNNHLKNNKKQVKMMELSIDSTSRSNHGKIINKINYKNKLLLLFNNQKVNFHIHI